MDEILHLKNKIRNFFWMPCFGRVRNVSSQKLSKSTVLDNFFGHGNSEPIRKSATQKRPKNRGKAVVFKKKSKRRFHISLVLVLKEPFSVPSKPNHGFRKAALFRPRRVTNSNLKADSNYFQMLIAGFTSNSNAGLIHIR